MLELEVLLPNFCSCEQCVQYFAHTLNLVTKATLCQFKKREKEKKCTKAPDNRLFDNVSLLEPVKNAGSDNKDNNLLDLEDILSLVDDKGSV